MSRLRLYVHSVFSGYALLATNIIYTLASVPLALAFLPKAEFGLWAMTSQLIGFLALVDAGMGGAVGRILIDHKDHKYDSDYGSLVQTAAAVNAVQGLIILLLAGVVAVSVGPLLRIPLAQQQVFQWLAFGQGAVLAIQFASRIFGNLLVAHQRNDFGNYLNCLSLVISFAVLWLSFAAGAGVMALVWSQLVGALVTAILAWLCCRQLKLLPLPGKWGRPSWPRFVEVFRLGQSVFLFLVGYQLIYASPTIIVTRAVGLEAAAVWSICTRPFMLLLQVITRIFDAGAPALAEMMVRGEHDRLFSRFRSLVGLTVSMSVATGSLFVISNQPFVHLWTAGKIGWPVWNDALLGLWLITLSLLHVHTGLVIQTKNLGSLPYVVLAQGIVFMGTTLLLVFKMKLPGITTMLTAAVVCGLALTLPYSIWRTSRYFHIPVSVVAWDWVAPAGRLLVIVGPLAIGLWWVTEPLQNITKLLVRIVGMALPLSIFFFRIGIDATVRQDLLARAPAYLKGPLRLLIGVPAI